MPSDMKKAGLIILLIFTTIQLSISQEKTKDSELEKYLRKSEGYYMHPNIIKVNTLAIAFSNISVSYERALAPRLSLLLSAGYKYAGKEPKVFEVNGSTIDASFDQITGYSAAPELRYYMKTCGSRHIEGFYLGLYGRYTFYTTGADFSYFPESQQVEFYKATIDLTEVGVGIQLGYQLMLWERLSLDFMFFGPRYSRLNLIYEFDKEVSQEFLDDMSDYINDVIDRFGIDYDVELKQSGDTRTSSSFSFANMRFGISIGFAF